MTTPADPAALRQRRHGDPSTPLRDIGEQALLQRLAALAASVRSDRLVVGPGDDAAVFRPGPGRDVVISQDAVVEGKDFRWDWITPYQLGARALQVALSDLAGSGADPELCVATLCASGDVLIDDVLAIQAGLCASAAASACAVAGGDISDIDGPLVLDVMVLGTTEKDAQLRAAAAQPGDALVVTGTLGRAAAGLALLFGREAAGVDTATAESWRAAQVQPAARLDEGRALAAAGVRCGTDISDGLAVSAAIIARESHCAVELWRDAVPVDAALRGWDDWFALAVAGGEDFEILAAVAPDRLAALVASWPASLAPLTVVGRVTGGDGVVCCDHQGGAPVDLPRPRSLHYGMP